VSSTVATPPDRPLALGDLLALRAAFPLDVSRGARTLLVGCDAPGTTQLFLLPAGGGPLEQLTDFAEPVDGLLLPDGRVLLTLDESGNERGQLHVLAGGETGPLVVDPRFIHRTPKVSRDGARLAYATNRRNGRDFDVFVRELATGSERAVFGGGWCEVDGFSPDGRRLAVRRETEEAGDNELWLVDLETGAATEVSPHEDGAAIGAPAWTADGGFLVASSVGRDLRAVLRDGIEPVLESGWDLECWTDREGRALLVEANEDGYSRLELRDALSLELRAEVPLPGRGVVEHPVFSPDGSRLWFSFSSPVLPPDVWLWEDGALSRLTDAGAPTGLREPELCRYDSHDGLSVPYFLWEPDGEGPFPVVVTVHGGPEAQYRPAWLPSFTPLTQHLVSRGYAVAAPNVRGSSGYGKRYEHLDDGRLRLDSVRDLAALHAALTVRPRIDGSRAVLYGRSYGGYMVLAGLAFQPELWAAGVESVGISNLVTFLENTADWRRAVREREYGRLDLDRAFLLDASPLTHVDAIRAPLFVQHGAHDPRVPLSETQQIHDVLAEKGIRCELLVHDDEGHAIGKLANRVETFERAVAFLESVLGGVGARR
jgi:dipeptidyl aminopeptidase/acylaminoacyl peptidase